MRVSADFSVSVDHVSFCVIDVNTELLNAHILTFDRFAEVLGLVLGGFDYTNDVTKLLILIADHFLLVLKDLTVMKITVLVTLSIVTFIILDLPSPGGKRCLVALHSAIALSQSSSYEPPPTLSLDSEILVN